MSSATRHGVRILDPGNGHIYSSRAFHHAAGHILITADLHCLKPLNPQQNITAISSRDSTYSLHCSSSFWFSQFHIKDPIR